MSGPLYTSAAQNDLADILRFIARDKPAAALSWIERIESKCLLIAKNPEMGELQPQLGAGVRASIVGRYIIFHRHVNGRVEILRVIAGDRKVTQL